MLFENTGDAPLMINTGNNSVQIQAMGALESDSRGDFQVVSQRLLGAPTLPAGQPERQPADPARLVRRQRRLQAVEERTTTSVARLQFTSSSDAATESVAARGQEHR